MELNKVKKYLQNYLDFVATPRFNQEPNEDGIESFVVQEILKGSYQPPIFHIFLDSTPIVNLPSMSTKSKLKDLEKDIQDFIKMFSINFKVKVHLNKKPVFRGNETPKPFWGTQNKRK
jgi:hypothetical protein